MTHVDPVIVRIFHLSDALSMVGDHPRCCGPVRHASENELGNLLP